MPKKLAARLRRGLELDDEDFDQLYPEWGRSLSYVHWTPVAVARRAATWLVTRPGARVLDVGSGVGKFALVGALVTDGLFYGIEQRRQFVDAAQAAARGMGATRARFLHGNMMELDWTVFDAFYLYNPFVEEIVSLESGNRTASADVDLVRAYVDFVQRQLSRAPLGTRVVTYHGFGGELPSGYRREPQQGAAVEDLELWVRCGAAKA